MCAVQCANVSTPISDDMDANACIIEESWGHLDVNGKYNAPQLMVSSSTYNVHIL